MMFTAEFFFIGSTTTRIARKIDAENWEAAYTAAQSLQNEHWKFICVRADDPPKRTPAKKIEEGDPFDFGHPEEWRFIAVLRDCTSGSAFNMTLVASSWSDALSRIEKFYEGRGAILTSLTCQHE